MERRAAVAGLFYDADKENLNRSIQECFLGSFGPGMLPKAPQSGAKRNILGLVCPHAGYIYSGSAAACAYNELANDGLPDIAVLLGPNHYGIGAAIAISSALRWTTPLGALDVDRDVVNDIVKSSNYIEISDIAHEKEHSLEVQLPFLQFIGGDKIKVVPITIGSLDLSDALLLAGDLGTAIAEALEGKNAVVIASTDLSHYESQAAAASKDGMAIDKILKMDGEGLLRTVHDNSITMCGATGAAVMLEVCKSLGATQARKLKYYTSGDITGDFSEVVGYAALSVCR